MSKYTHVQSQLQQNILLPVTFVHSLFKAPVVYCSLLHYFPNKYLHLFSKCQVFSSEKDMHGTWYVNLATHLFLKFYHVCLCQWSSMCMSIHMEARGHTQVSLFRYYLSQPIALMGQGWLTSNSQEPTSFPGMGLQVWAISLGFIYRTSSDGSQALMLTRQMFSHLSSTCSRFFLKNRNLPQDVIHLSPIIAPLPPFALHQ